MKKINLFAFIPLAIFIAIGAMFLWGMYGKRVSKDESPLIGKPLPAISGGTLDGGTINFDNTSGQPLILNFFASWCAPCRDEHKQLLQMAGATKVKIIGIAYRDDPKETRNYIDELGNPYTDIIIDRQGGIGASLGLSGVPETYIVGADGIIKYKHKGPITPKDASDLLKKAQ